MKYRIKVMQNGHGRRQYYPQSKFLIFWTSFKGSDRFPIVYDHEVTARAFLNRHIVEKAGAKLEKAKCVDKICCNHLEEDMKKW